MKNYRYVGDVSLSYDRAKQYDNECSIHVYDDGGSCMAIYLGMAMEMP